MNWRGKFFIVVGSILFSLSVQANVKAASASLYFSPNSITSEINKTFSVSIMVSGNQAINSASGSINFDSAYLSAVSVNKTGSAFSLWTQEPTIAGNSVAFGGGLPNPGLMGSGKIFSVSFKAKMVGSTTLSISNGKVLANDGKGTNILASSGSLKVTINEVLSGITISSSTHPNQDSWYKERSLKLAWNKPANVKGFNFVFSKQNGSALKNQRNTTESLFTYDNLEEGVYIFKLTAVFSTGERESAFRVQIDLTAPEPFNINVNQQSPTDAFPLISFEAKDNLSGIDYYLILLDGQEVGKTKETSLKLPRVRPGVHELEVEAVDKAGNTTRSKIQLKVEGFEGPIITNYPKFVSVLQPITLKGRALYGAKVQLFVDNIAQERPFIVKENLSDHQKAKIESAQLKEDDQVEWIYTYHGVLKPGIHRFHAIQIKADESESNPSNTVNVRVLWTSISLGGVIVPMALIAFILLIFALLTVPLIIILWRRGRRHFKGITQKLLGLKKDFDSQIHNTQNDIGKDIDNYLDKPKALKAQISSELDELKRELDDSLEQTIDQAKKEEK